MLAALVRVPVASRLPMDIDRYAWKVLDTAGSLKGNFDAVKDFPWRPCALPKNIQIEALVGCSGTVDRQCYTKPTEERKCRLTLD